MFPPYFLLTDLQSTSLNKNGSKQQTLVFE
jgi:hypothetical protein